MKYLLLIITLVLLAGSISWSQDDSAYFYIGSIDGSPVNTSIGDDFLIPVYFEGGTDIWISELYLTFAAQYEYINRFNLAECSSDYWPFDAGADGWPVREFGDYNDDTNPDYPNASGWHSISFTGNARSVYPDSPYLHSDVPIHILDFSYHTLLDTSFIGQTVSAVGPGHGPSEDAVNSCYDSVGGSYPIAVQYSELFFVPPQGNAIYGHVRNMINEPVESVHVVVEGAGSTVETWTDDNGSYFLSMPDNDNCDVYYSHPDYVDTSITDLPTGDEPSYQHYYFDITMRPDGTAYLWAGGYFDEEYNWHDTITVAPNQTFNVPIYFYGGPDVWIENIVYPLGARYDIIDSFDVEGCSDDYWPFNTGQLGWAPSEFGNYNDDTHPTHPNPPGYHSINFVGFATQVPQNPRPDWLHAATPIHILDFRVHVIDDLPTSDTLLSDVFIRGEDPIGSDAGVVGDTLGGPGYPVVTSYAVLSFKDKYPYLPGDVNMRIGAWPPSTIGSDVTYLVNYLRGPSNPECFLDGFWASADVNGDCNIIGSDATRLVNYFRGQAELQTCPDYPPLWPTPYDIPIQPPAGWPNCE